MEVNADSGIAEGGGHTSRWLLWKLPGLRRRLSHLDGTSLCALFQQGASAAGQPKRKRHFFFFSESSPLFYTQKTISVYIVTLLAGLFLLWYLQSPFII